MAALGSIRSGSGSSPCSGTSQPFSIVNPCVPPSFDPMGSTLVSFSETVQSQISASPSNPCLVQEDPTISLLMGQEAKDEEYYFGKIL
jgi:hypothetical protein